MVWLGPCTRAPSASGHIFASRTIVAASEIRGGSFNGGKTQWLRVLGDGLTTTLLSYFPMGSIALVELDRRLARPEPHDAGVIKRRGFELVFSGVVHLQVATHRNANTMR